MKKILATVAGLVSFALMGTACSAVDTKETTSTTPIAVSTVTPENIRDEFREQRASRGAARPAAKPVPAKTPVVKKTPKATPKPKVVKPKPKRVYKPKAKVYKVKKKIVKPKKVYKKTYKVKKRVKRSKDTRVRVSGIAACIAKYESGGNPRAQNPRSSASGLYQFIDGTWNNYGGYRRAKDAPVSVQTRKFYQVWNGGRGAGNWVVKHKCGY